MTVSSRNIVESIAKVNQNDWNSLAQGENIYLSIAYLSGLEEAMKDTMKFFYAISYNEENEPVLISSFQLVQFTDKRKMYSDLICKFGNHVKNKFKDGFNLKMLVAGNVFSDGENGFVHADSLDPATAIQEVDAISDELKTEWKVKEEASMTLFKEFWPKSTEFSDILKKNSYRDFMIDVNMVLDIHPSWSSMDDYLASMTTKYRTRAKGVYKKSKEIVAQSLNTDEIEAQSSDIRELFENVLSKSDFDYGTLKVSAFVNFKRNLGEDFSLRAFYLNDKMVGFSTAIFNQNHMEATYVGMDYQNNKDFAVYQRMLYDYVEQALERKVENLQLGRTAELIKSSIGALPTNMKLYVKHRKAFPNLLLKPILQSISPSEFELRQPFKANFTN